MNVKKIEENKFWVIKQLFYDQDCVLTQGDPVPETSWSELQERLNRERKTCSSKALN